MAVFRTVAGSFAPMGNWTRRILIVEDDPFTATLVESVLTREHFEVQVCSDAATARSVAAEMDPDLALLDVNLGQGPSGVQLGFALEQAHPGMVIVYLTRYPTALVQAGSTAEHLADKVVLSKDDVTDAEALVEAIESALRGHTSTPEIAGDPQLQRMTPTQMEILRLLSSGMTNSAIAQHRSTSERAVEKQVKAIYTALDLESDKTTNARVLAALRYSETMGDTTPLDEADADVLSG
jgi:DNA-binding NarL/FixJ family response regulator